MRKHWQRLIVGALTGAAPTMAADGFALSGARRSWVPDRLGSWVPDRLGRLAPTASRGRWLASRAVTSVRDVVLAAVARLLASCAASDDAARSARTMPVSGS